MARKISREVNPEAGTIKFLVEGKDPILVSLDDVAQLARRLALHGLSQKIGDSAAGAETTDEAYKALQDTTADLMAGNWTTRVSTGVARTSYLARAIAEYKGCDVNAAKAAIDRLEEAGEAGEAKLKEIRKALKPIIARMQAEDAVKKAQEAKGQAVGELALEV